MSRAEHLQKEVLMLRRQAKKDATEIKDLGHFKEIVVLIDKLCEHEATSVEIVSPNPEFDGSHQKIIHRDYTRPEWNIDDVAHEGYDGEEFTGDTLVECLRKAVAAKEE